MLEWMVIRIEVGTSQLKALRYGLSPVMGEVALIPSLAQYWIGAFAQQIQGRA